MTERGRRYGRKKKIRSSRIIIVIEIVEIVVVRPPGHGSRTSPPPAGEMTAPRMTPDCESVPQRRNYPPPPPPPLPTPLLEDRMRDNLLMKRQSKF